jgi:hypothetical protein
MKDLGPRLVPHDCPVCGPRVEAPAMAHVRCRCGKECTARTEPWLAALLADGQRPRVEVERLAADAGLSWAEVTAAAKVLGVRSVTRGGERAWRLAPSRALSALTPQRAGSRKSPFRGVEGGSRHQEPAMSREMA